MTNTISKYNRLQLLTKETDGIDELFSYTKNSFEIFNCDFQLQKLEDEPQVSVWEEYIEEAKVHGVFPTLKKYLVQFQFLIKEGISQTDDYKKATLKGISTSDMSDAIGLSLEAPEQLNLFLHTSLAGRIPVLVTKNRNDFKTLVRALTYRNEPKAIPDSMGAAMIKGLNNWDRLRRGLSKFSQKEILSNRSLYQDRIIVLSKIPYSNVAAQAMNLNEEEWLEHSLKIRLNHECAHYFTLRYFGEMTNHMHDEIIADYMGICSVLPNFNSEWFLRFIGLENYPDFRLSGRMKNYLGNPPLSSSAFKVLQKIMFRASNNLEIFDAKISKTGADSSRFIRMQTLCSLDLLDMASDDGAENLFKNYNHLAKKY
jgi:hypothetical protein